jgi:hypothetical protein
MPVRYEPCRQQDEPDASAQQELKPCPSCGTPPARAEAAEAALATARAEGAAAERAVVLAELRDELLLGHKFRPPRAEADPHRVLWTTPSELRGRLRRLQPESLWFVRQRPRLLEALDEVEQAWKRSRKR